MTYYRLSYAQVALKLDLFNAAPPTNYVLAWIFLQGLAVHIDRDSVVYHLSHGSRDDLALAACFAPLMFTDLQAGHSDVLLCSDASGNYIAPVSAPVPKKLSQEL